MMNERKTWIRIELGFACFSCCFIFGVQINCMCQTRSKRSQSEMNKQNAKHFSLENFNCEQNNDNCKINK